MNDSVTGRTFRSLRHRNFRLFFVGQFVSQAGTWMQLTALSWLVVRLTDDGLALGLVSACIFGPLLVGGAWAGTLADRLPKRRYLLVLQAAAAAHAAVLAVVVLTGRQTMGLVYGLALAYGVLNALDNPVRRSLLTEMVDEDDVSNAVSLNSTLMTSSKVVGPALAGVLIATVGIEWCFVGNAVSYAAVLVGLSMMRQAEMRPAPLVPRGRGQVREGLRFVWGDPVLRTTVVMMGVIGTLAFNSQVLMPLMARRTFAGGAQTFAALSSVQSLGALCGSLVVASRRGVSLKWVSNAALVFGCTQAAFAASPNLVTALPVAAAAGGAGVAFISASNGVLQLETPPNLRGRVMALSAILFLGSTPIGGPLVGWVSERTDPRMGLALGAVASLLAGGWGRLRVAPDAQRAAPVAIATTRS